MTATMPTKVDTAHELEARDQARAAEYRATIDPLPSPEKIAAPIFEVFAKLVMVGDNRLGREHLQYLVSEGLLGAEIDEVLECKRRVVDDFVAVTERCTVGDEAGLASAS